MKWGVFELVKVDKEKWEFDAKYLPDDKDFKHPPKLTWLVKDEAKTLRFKIETYGHLLTVKKPEANKEFKEFVNKDSYSFEYWLGEGYLRNLMVGDII